VTSGDTAFNSGSPSRRVLAARRRLRTEPAELLQLMAMAYGGKRPEDAAEAEERGHAALMPTRRLHNRKPGPRGRAFFSSPRATRL
jgi:hypothetical protein